MIIKCPSRFILFVLLFSIAGCWKTKEDSNLVGSKPETTEYKWVTVNVSVLKNLDSAPIQGAIVELGMNNYSDISLSTDGSGQVSFNLQSYHWGTNGSVYPERSQTYFIRAYSTGFVTSPWIAVRATYSNPNPTKTIYLALE